MTKDEALDLALEFVEANHFGGPDAFELITAIKQALALDKKAENARELGLDYEPVGEAYLCNKCQTPFDGAWECPNCGHRSATKEPVYTTPPAQPAPVQEGRDWSLLEATQESLREHMAEIKRLKEAQPAVPDAIGPNEEYFAYVAADAIRARSNT